MREIHCEEISALVERLCIKANTVLPPELAMMLECASEAEECEAMIDQLIRAQRGSNQFNSHNKESNKHFTML